VAFQQADYVAWNLWASINRRPLLPFKYQHLGDMMSLGRVRGAVTLPLPVAPPLHQALNNGLLASLLQAAGIKCAVAPRLTRLLCRPFVGTCNVDVFCAMYACKWSPGLARQEVLM
jgi:NADH dehydrogenase FAD-containing subunit